jgi:acylphosphatase
MCLTIERAGERQHMQDWKTRNDPSHRQRETFRGKQEKEKAMANFDGEFFIFNRNSGKVIVVAGGSSDNGANICQWQYSGNDDQQWTLETTDGEYYTIKNRHSGKVIVVAGGSTANGANICQWQYSGNTDQQWKIENETEEYYKITNRNSEKVIVVAGGSSDNGANICQWQHSGNADQQWSLLKVTK